MDNKLKKVLYIIFILCLFRVYYAFIIDTNSYKESNLKIIGNIIKISKEEDKTIIDIKAKDKYRITVYGNLSYELGDKIKVSGIFKTPNNNTIFNLFNYRKYLLSKNIKMVSNDSNIKLISKNKNILYDIKNSIIKHINHYKTSSYLNTFILGDTSGIKDDVIQSYRNIGISHLFSVSGMHVSLFIVVINYIFKKNKYKNIIIVSFLLFFLFLTNFTESLLRCFLFIILSFINKKFDLKLNSINLIILTASILLIINPFLIYSISFLFSIIITFFIILSKNLFENFNYIKKTFVISIICFLSSVPVLATYFFKINLLTPFFNIIFIPFISFIIFPLSIITFMIPQLDIIYMFFIDILEYLVCFLDEIKIFTFAISKPNIIICFLYYLSLYFFIKKDWKFILIFLIILFININSRFFIMNFKITFLDVGQGDNTIIIFPFGKTVIVDTGGVFNSNYSISKKSIIPCLNSYGINKIDLLILTHGDYDHMGEAINLVENFKVEKVIFNCGEFNELELDLIKVLDKKKIPYYSCVKELNIDDNKLYFLNNNDYGNENDNSSVIYTEFNNHKFLFMGDAGVGVEEDLIKKYKLQDIDVLKVGHHGSRTSSGKKFINEINPKYGVISVGKNNRYGHPNKEVLENLENSKIYRTDEDGSIIFKIKNNKLNIETCAP